MSRRTNKNDRRGGRIVYITILKVQERKLGHSSRHFSGKYRQRRNDVRRKGEGVLSSLSNFREGFAPIKRGSFCATLRRRLRWKLYVRVYPNSLSSRYWERYMKYFARVVAWIGWGVDSGVGRWLGGVVYSNLSPNFKLKFDDFSGFFLVSAPT